MAKFCPNCGMELTEGTKFCGRCGAAVDGQSTNVNAAAYTHSASQTGAKSKIVAGLLGIFLGAWGIHNFYLGYTKKGVIQIVVTLCSCGIASLWGFIEGILILCGNIDRDANGNPLGD